MGNFVVGNGTIYTWWFRCVQGVLDKFILIDSVRALDLTQPHPLPIPARIGRFDRSRTDG